MILYIRTFNSGFPAIDQGELKEVDKAYSLSSGFKQPNQIPIAMAVEKVIAENKTSADKITNAIKKVEENKSDKGAGIFKKISFDIKRSVTALANGTNWNENESRFVKFISTDPRQKGFTFSAASSLSPDEWSVLYQFVKTIF